MIVPIAVLITLTQVQELKYPVVEGAIEGCDARVLVPIQATLTKTLFSKPIGEEKAYKELWERAKKHGADAVINADVGPPNKNWMGPLGARIVTGEAIVCTNIAKGK